MNNNSTDICADIHEAVLAAHAVAYSTASLFKGHHTVKDGNRYINPEPAISHGNPIIHGIFSNTLDFISLSSLVVGGKMDTQCKNSMKVMSVTDIRKFLIQGFTAKKDWRVGDVRVSVRSFMEPILAFLKQYADQMEVYVNIYDNKLTYTDVFGLVIVSKRATGAPNLVWEITIDDAYLVPPLSTSGLFCRN